MRYTKVYETHFCSVYKISLTNLYPFSTVERFIKKLKWESLKFADIKDELQLILWLYLTIFLTCHWHVASTFNYLQFTILSTLNLIVIRNIVAMVNVVFKNF